MTDHGRGAEAAMASGATAGDIDVSLIICTRNRCEQLAYCLQSLVGNEFDRSWELVIVDNGSTDATRTVVQEFSRNSAFPVVYVSEPTPGLWKRT